VGEELRVNASVTIPAHDLTWSAARSSGSGGQNVNKVSSKVDLRFDLDGTTALTRTVKDRLRELPGVRLDARGRVVVTSQKTRDQHRNLEDARARLAELVRAASKRPKKRRPTKPSRAAKRRRLDDKRKHSEKKASRRKVRREEL
jgi:ribosome-associated protein